MARKIVKRLISMALAAVILFTPGCGNSNGGNLPSAENEKKNEQGSGDSDIAMGRYEEEETDLSDNLANVREMKRFSDGRLVITDASSGIWVSNDNGASWESENTKYLEEKLADPAVAADYEAVTEVSGQIAELRERSELLLLRWTELSEELERSETDEG